MIWICFPCFNMTYLEEGIIRAIASAVAKSIRDDKAIRVLR